MLYQTILDRYLLYKKYLTKELLLFLGGIIVVIFYVFFWSAPSTFPVSSAYDLKNGDTISVVSRDLTSHQVIRSTFWLKSFTYIFSLGSMKIVEGDYTFYKRQSVFEIAWRITHGNLDTKPIRITIPEGLNSSEIADIYAKYIPSFNKQVFLSLVIDQKLEGYLFPDTYFLMPNASEDAIVAIMQNTFNEKIQTLQSDIKIFGKSQSDIVKMASILEEEANSDESKKIVAGILWKRISLGMPLQVDSSFKYINSKTTAQLSLSDLQIDSPYNSYTHKGLPPTPISNPGISTIEDAVNPTQTQYLYFLSDDKGNMHYAVTFEQHVANKLKYLKN